MKNRETMKSLHQASVELQRASDTTGIYRVLKKIPTAMAAINSAMYDIYELENIPVTKEKEKRDED